MDQYFDELVSLYESDSFPRVLLLNGKKGIGKFTLTFHFLNPLPRFPLRFQESAEETQMGSDSNAKAIIAEKAKKKGDAKKRSQQVSSFVAARCARCRAKDCYSHSRDDAAECAEWGPAAATLALGVAPHTADVVAPFCANITGVCRAVPTLHSWLMCS